MFNNDGPSEFNLGAEASTSTLGSIASWVGWLLLMALAVVTAVHGVSIVQAHTNLTMSEGDIFSIIRVGGIFLVELFAITTAVLLATHTLRAQQKVMALAVEATWFVFAAANLISSFAIEAGGEMPRFVNTWIVYGLPVSVLIMGALFYIMLRLDPDAKMADEKAELQARFAQIRHAADLEVMVSPQMKAVIRQAQWLKLPSIIGQQLNLSDAQIAALSSQAPKLLDLNQNGVPDIEEYNVDQRSAPLPPESSGSLTIYGPSSSPLDRAPTRAKAVAEVGVRPLKVTTEVPTQGPTSAEVQVPGLDAPATPSSPDATPDEAARAATQARRRARRRNGKRS